MADDYGQDPTTAGQLTVGSSLTGIIDERPPFSAGGPDHDWFAVQLTAGHNYLIDVGGIGAPGIGLSSPALALRNASGVSLASDEAQGRDAQLYLHANNSGTYYADVSGHDTGIPELPRPSTGTYAIQIQDLGTALTTRFQTASLGINAFGASPASGGWTSENLYPRMLAQVDGDGRPNFAGSPIGSPIGDGFADIVAFGSQGMYVARGTSDGHFAAPSLAIAGFGADASAGGWTSQDQYPRLLGDVNQDGRDDVVAFGASGVYVDLATNNGNFSPGATFALPDFGASPDAGGWASQDRYPRLLGDVGGNRFVPNRGDGIKDIVAFAEDGVWVALATGSGGFSTPFFSRADFGVAAAAGDWSSQDDTPRFVADVNGDGMADIIGFGQDGTWVSPSTGSGHFAAPQLVLNAFGSSAAAGGWTSQDATPRQVADVNGDGRADIVGFGDTGVYVALGQADGTFTAAQQDFQGFGSSPAAGGWTSQDVYPRLLGDVTGDHRADIVAFGDAATYVAVSHDYFAV